MSVTHADPHQRDTRRAVRLKGNLKALGVYEKLRAEIDLAEIGESFTDLQPSGKAFKGRCPHPDHEDQEPSFYVYSDGHFHCYGCSWHGDVTDLWSGVKGLTSGYAAALDLAREYDVRLLKP